MNNSNKISVSYFWKLQLMIGILMIIVGAGLAYLVFWAISSSGNASSRQVSDWRFDRMIGAAMFASLILLLIGIAAIFISLIGARKKALIFDEKEIILFPNTKRVKGPFGWEEIGWFGFVMIEKVYRGKAYPYQQLQFKNHQGDLLAAVYTSGWNEDKDYIFHCMLKFWQKKHPSLTMPNDLNR